MTMQPPPPGPGSVPEYMVSSLPWVTASTVASGSFVQHDFPFLTRFFKVRNTGGTQVSLGFTLDGLQGSKRIVLNTSQSFEGEFRVRALFITCPQTSQTGSYELIAGLTQIQSRMFPLFTELTSSGLSV